MTTGMQQETFQYWGPTPQPTPPTQPTQYACPPTYLPPTWGPPPAPTAWAPPPKPNRQNTGWLIAGAAALTALVVGGAALLGGGRVDTTGSGHSQASVPAPVSTSSSPIPPSDFPSTTPAKQPTPSGETRSTWPAAFAPFSALLGSGPDGTAFHGAHCSTGKLITNTVAAVSCADPNGIVFTAYEFATAGDVTGLLTAIQKDGTSVTGWADGSGHRRGYVAVLKFHDGSAVVTSFDAHPTMLIDVSGAHAAAVKAEWSAMPLSS
jgi:hypothetical protein